MHHLFDHERLDVYQKALELITWTTELFERFPKKCDAWNHLERASNSIVFNTAEGNGRFQNKERQHFFGIARSSGLECAGCLDVLVARKVIPAQEITEGKKMPQAIINMLTGLIRRSDSGVREDHAEYGEGSGFD